MAKLTINIFAKSNNCIMNKILMANETATSK